MNTTKEIIPKYDLQTVWDEPQIRALPSEIKLGLTLLLQVEYCRGVNASQLATNQETPE